MWNLGDWIEAVCVASCDLKGTYPIDDAHVRHVLTEFAKLEPAIREHVLGVLSEGAE